MIAKRTIDRARPDVVDVFRSLKPYKGGDELLRAVHDLDISDKHKLLIPLINISLVRNFFIRRISDGTPMLSIGTLKLSPDHGVDFYTAPASENLQYGNDGDFAFEVLFGEGPVHAKPIAPTLAQMAQLVCEIIDRFARHIAANPIVVQA